MNGIGRLKIARNGYIVMAAVFCVLGIFLMANPQKAMEILCILAGILFVADGIIKIIGYFSRDFYCLAFHFDLGFDPGKKRIYPSSDLCDFWPADPYRCTSSDTDVCGGKKIRNEALVGNFDSCSYHRNIWNDPSHRPGWRSKDNRYLCRSGIFAGRNPEAVCRHLHSPYPG